MAITEIANMKLQLASILCFDKYSYFRHMGKAKIDRRPLSYGSSIRELEAHRKKSIPVGCSSWPHVLRDGLMDMGSFSAAVNSADRRTSPWSDRRTHPKRRQPSPALPLAEVAF